jgi:hypothetical protein
MAASACAVASAAEEELVAVEAADATDGVVVGTAADFNTGPGESPSSIGSLCCPSPLFVDAYTTNMHREIGSGAVRNRRAECSVLCAT